MAAFSFTFCTTTKLTTRAIALVAASLAVPLALTTATRAQPPCNEPFFKLLNQPLRKFCENNGVRLHKVHPLDPTYECSGGEWAEAKANIDWVLFGDAGAQKSYKHAMDEFKRTGCIAGNMSWDRPLFAILYAQRHNAHAQCAIYDCRANFGGAAGYYNTLVESGKIK